LILESLRAGVVFLPRAWSRPWFVALIAMTAAAGLATVISAGATAWLSPAIVVLAVFYLPLAQAPLYALAASQAAPLNEGVARYLRLLAVNLLTLVFLAAPALLLSVIGLGVAYGMAYAQPGFDPKNAATWTASGPVLLGGGAVVAVGGLGMLWLLSRVSLGPAASVAERRVVMLSTWPLTRGLGWRIAAARLVLGGAALLLLWLVQRLIPAGASPQIAPIVCDVLFVAVGLPVEVGVLSFFFDHRSPMPVTP
jgi:hypothetical protein